jgi:hypothetical protein
MFLNAININNKKINDWGMEMAKSGIKQERRVKSNIIRKSIRTLILPLILLSTSGSFKFKNVNVLVEQKYIPFTTNCPESASARNKDIKKHDEKHDGLIFALNGNGIKYHDQKFDENDQSQGINSKDQGNEKKAIFEGKVISFAVPATFTLELANNALLKGILSSKEIEKAKEQNRDVNLFVYLPDLLFNPESAMFVLSPVFSNMVISDKSSKILVSKEGFSVIFEYCEFKNNMITIASNLSMKLLDYKKETGQEEHNKEHNDTRDSSNDKERDK